MIIRLVKMGSNKQKPKTETAICLRKCSEEPQPIENFRKLLKGSDSRDSVCKECRKKEAKSYRDRKKEDRNLYNNFF